MMVDEWIWPYSADLSAAKSSNIALQASGAREGEGEEKVKVWYNFEKGRFSLWVELPFLNSHSLGVFRIQQTGNFG